MRKDTSDMLLLSPEDRSYVGVGWLQAVSMLRSEKLFEAQKGLDQLLGMWKQLSDSGTLGGDIVPGVSEELRKAPEGFSTHSQTLRRVTGACSAFLKQHTLIDDHVTVMEFAESILKTLEILGVIYYAEGCTNETDDGEG